MIKSFFLKRIKRQIIRELFTLFSGESLVQVISVISYLILPKLYSPEDFGEFALFSTTINLLLICLSGRYEAAIVIAKEPGTARSLLILTHQLLILLISAIAIVLLLAKTFSLELFAVINNYFISFLLVLALAGQVGILHFWLLRQRDYKKVSLYKVLQRVTTLIAAIGIFLISPKINGLIYSLIIGNLIALVILKKKKLFNSLPPLKPWAINTQLLKDFKDFPLFSVPTLFIAFLSLQLPVFVIGAFFDNESLGFYSVASSIIFLPGTILLSVIHNFYYPMLAKKIEKGESGKNGLIKSLQAVFATLLVPMILLILYAEDLITFIFGIEWTTTGKIISILAPLILYKPINNLLTINFTVYRKQNLGLYFNLLKIALVFTALFTGVYFEDLLLTLQLLTMALILYLCITFIKVMHIFKQHTSTNYPILAKE